MKKRMLKPVLCMIAILTAVALSLSAVVYRALCCFDLFDDAAMAAGYLSFPNGSLSGEPVTESADVRPLTADPDPTRSPTERPTSSGSGEEFPVVEKLITQGDLSYDNFSVKNSTPYDPDFREVLASDLPFTLADNHTVQVLIYHTHSCESYLDEDEGYYDSDYYPRSTDGAQGVIAVGNVITETLKENGIGAVHDTTLHDYPSYEGSYGRSWDTAEEYLKKYPGIKVTLDIHRDSMTADDGTKYKPTFTYHDQKAAQIMIMTGYDESGDFDFWDENLIFATKLQQKCEALYPGMTRPLYFGEFTYNMDFNNGSLLIEVGTDANTAEEAKRSGEYLAIALSSVLQKG